MKKLLLLFFLIFLNYTKTSNANNVKNLNLPIIKQLDKQYLNLIDRNGKITNLKEFNKNGKVLVFEGKNFDVKETVYLFIEKTKSKDNKFNFQGTYTRNLLSDFNELPYCDNQNDEYIMPYMNIKLDIDNFTFEEVIFDKFTQETQYKIKQFYNQKNFDDLQQFISGYVQCGVKIYSNKLSKKIISLLK